MFSLAAQSTCWTRGRCHQAVEASNLSPSPFGQPTSVCYALLACLSRTRDLRSYVTVFFYQTLIFHVAHVQTVQFPDLYVVRNSVTFFQLFILLLTVFTAHFESLSIEPYLRSIQTVSLVFWEIRAIDQSINQCILMSIKKVDQRAGQLSLPHVRNN